MPHFRTLTEISYELADRIPPLFNEGPIFFLAQNEKEVRSLQQLCQYWKEDFPIESIISPSYQEHNALSKAEYKTLVTKLRTGDTMRISELTHRLVKLGFERFPRAVASRTFAVRGNVVDIIDRRATRVEFTDNIIESIHWYDPNTQLSGQACLNPVTIWPAQVAPHVPIWTESELTYEFVTPKFYHKRFGLLKKDIEKYLTILVSTYYPKEVIKVIPNAQCIKVVPGLEGFVYSKKDFIFLTDEHLFGREERTEEFDTELDVSSLQPGEYVVHIDHGIAIFHGLKKMDGQEYMELNYADNDKLYVPLDKANRVEQYLGEDNPKLTRLSGAQWETVVQKVEEDVRITARELLDLAASRETAEAKPVPEKVSSEESHIAHDVDFELTSDQVQAIQDIITDLANTKPMNRLLCGDVGFGKTEVALRAAAHVIEEGGQVAILAPTTVLAQQHYETLQKRLEPYGIKVGVLSRLISAKEQTAVVQDLAKGRIDIVIGTHRLLSKDIIIPKLQLAIIDEEQRFGVKHKEYFKALRSSAHVLTMTATPIPRTLNLAMSGVHDISVLNTAPVNRLGITTVIEEFSPRAEVDAVAAELERQGQVYVVHNDLGTIYARQSFLKRKFPQARVEVVHGQMEPKRLISLMSDFHTGKVDILVASTIIENGLDIANANTLVVEHAEQFGLAQLYQLRGRIGRSSTKAYAYLLYYPQHLTAKAKKRLKALKNIKTLGGGFELAMQDLQIRGVGDILGKKQHGHVCQIGLHLYTRLLQRAIEELRGSS